MSHLDKKVFGKKTYSNLLKEIYDNQKKKEGQIAALISELKPLIQDIGKRSTFKRNNKSSITP